MRSALPALGSLLLVAGTATAQAPVCDDPTSTLLWRAAGEASEVYLYGSIHVGEKSFYPLAPTIETTFRSSDHLVFEVDPAQMDDPTVTAELLRRSRLPNGESLRDHVSAATLERLEETLGHLGIPVEPMLGFRPWFLNVTLSTALFSTLGYDPTQGIEMYLRREKPDDTTVLELETLDAQLDLLESLDGEDLLIHTLDQIDRGGDLVRRMVDGWRCGDHEGLEALFAEEFDAVGPMQDALQELEKRMFQDRNETMADGIEAFLDEGDGRYFVVVGAGHTLGEGGIVDRLRQEGYDVELVRLPAEDLPID